MHRFYIFNCFSFAVITLFAADVALVHLAPSTQCCAKVALRFRMVLHANADVLFLLLLLLSRQLPCPTPPATHEAPPPRQSLQTAAP